MIEVPEVQFEEHRLDNGLQVLLYRSHRVPLVHLSLHYRVGSSYEEPGMSGFAHLFEHMMFQGSENLGKNEHGRLVDQAGGSWNASTSKDRTNYYETLPSHCLDLGLWLEADRMRSLQVTAENFENQRRTVIEEKKQSYDNRPYGLAQLRFDELAYSNWAYAHPIIGSVEDLENATLEDARRFHRTYYGPGNATLVLSGDVDETALERVKKYFAPIPDRTAARPPDLGEPPQSQEKREDLPDSLAPLPAVSIGYHMPEPGSPEYYALSMLAVILALGDSSRLYRLMIHDHNWITNLSVGPNQYRGPELFQIWFQVQSGVDPDIVVEALERELQRGTREEPSSRELEKAKNQIAVRFVGRLARVSRIGELLAHYALFFDRPEMINRELARYLEVTPPDISRAAASVFRPHNRTLLLVKPNR